VEEQKWASRVQDRMWLEQAIPEQLAFVLACARYVAAWAEREQQLQPIMDGAWDAPDDDGETRRLINDATGYWETYDGVHAAGNALLAWACAYLAAHPGAVTRRPELAILRGERIAPADRARALDLALDLAAG